MRAILLVPLVTVPALSCIAKEPDFFPTANTIVDVDGPVFQAFSPAASLTGPFNINSFGFQVVDLPGSNGAPPSGVDLNSVEVLVGPTRKTATRTETTTRSTLPASRTAWWS
jgi:hypothetical protein